MPSLVRTTVGLLTALVLTATAAAAQRPQGPPPEGGPADEMSAGQLHQLFDAMLVMQAQNALSLTDQQYAQFISRLKVLQDTRRQNQQQRARLIGELQRLSNPRAAASASESEIKLRLSALQELESRAAAEIRRAYTGIDEVLTPLQQARFRVLEEAIERRKLELVSRARQNNPGRPNQRRPPGR